MGIDAELNVYKGLPYSVRSKRNSAGARINKVLVSVMDDVEIEFHIDYT